MEISQLAIQCFKEEFANNNKCDCQMDTMFCKRVWRSVYNSAEDIGIDSSGFTIKYLCNINQMTITCR